MSEPIRYLLASVFVLFASVASLDRRCALIDFEVPIGTEANGEDRLAGGAQCLHLSAPFLPSARAAAAPFVSNWRLRRHPQRRKEEPTSKKDPRRVGRIPAPARCDTQQASARTRPPLCLNGPRFTGYKGPFPDHDSRWSTIV